jgi:hypothetical protein
MNFVEVRPRVTGCLKRMPFKGRTVVKKGEFLFEIDDRPYDRMRPGYRQAGNWLRAVHREGILIPGDKAQVPEDAYLGKLDSPFREDFPGPGSRFPEPAPSPLSGSPGPYRRCPEGPL